MGPERRMQRAPLLSMADRPTCASFVDPLDTCGCLLATIPDSRLSARRATRMNLGVK